MRKQKKTVRILLIILAVLVLLVAVGGVFIAKVNKELEALSAIRIEDVDLSAVPDGTYEGQYSAFPVSAKVQVTVRGNQMSGIDLLQHVNGQGGAAEAIPEKVVQAQSLQVDMVSGATFSSKVILLAIHDALKSAAGE